MANKSVITGFGVGLSLESHGGHRKTVSHMEKNCRYEKLEHWNGNYVKKITISVQGNISVSHIENRNRERVFMTLLANSQKPDREDLEQRRTAD